ncbi:hypothetical protein CJ469_02586 [Nocardia farcinica]|nr:hypothetical protein CJ469_02586 [Nocardia farcinica]
MGGGLLGAVEVRVGLEVDVRTAARHRLVEVDAQVLDAARGQHVQLADHRAEGHLAVEQHDVDPRAEELGGHHTVTGGVAADVLVPVPLVAQRARDLDLHGLEQLGHGGFVGDAQAQRHDVGHRAAGAAHGRGGARRHRQAQDHVLGAGHLRQVGGERRDEQARRGIVVAGDGLGQQGVLLGAQRRAGDPVDRRGRGGAPGQAGAFLQARDALGPVLLVGFEAGAVAVGDLRLIEGLQVGRLGRARLGAGDLGGVELGDPVHEGHRAEAVERDVMRARVPEPARVGQAQRGRADQPVGDDVERAAVLRAHPLGRGRLGVLGVAQVDVLEGRVEGEVDRLERLTVALDDLQEAGAHLPGRGGAGTLERVDIQVTPEVDVLGDVDRHLRIDVLGIPDTQLRGRQWEVLATSFAVPADIQPVQP